MEDFKGKSRKDLQSILLTFTAQATPERREKKYPELDQLEAELLAAREERRKDKIKKKQQESSAEEREKKRLK